MYQAIIDEMNPILKQHAEDSDFITAFARGMMIFQILSVSQRPMTISDIAKITNFPRATVRRGLYTLLQLGYVIQEDRYYELSSKILTLAHSYLASQSLPNIAQPILENMAREANAPASMAILVHNEIIYIARASVNNGRIIADTLTIGSHLPAYCSSMGRVLLAAEPVEKQLEILNRSQLRPYTEHTIYEIEALLKKLDEVKTQGYALINQELEIGLYSIAVPVFDKSGHIVAALNINIHSLQQQADEVIANNLPILKRAASLLTSFI